MPVTATANNDPLAGLSSQAVHIIRRLSGAGSTKSVEYHGRVWPPSTHEAERQVIERGLATTDSTPKGRKAWFVLTDAGRALIPAIQERDKWEKQERADYEKAEIAKAALEAAAPDMLAVLERIRIEFKEFLGEDAPSRRIRDQIDAAIKKATTL